MSALAAGRFRFGPLLAAVIITVLLLMLFGATADVFLLLFLGILIGLYLGAVADAIHARTGLPWRPAFWLGMLLTAAGVAALFWVLVPPVIEQTQELVKVLPAHITQLESQIEHFLQRFPALRQVWQPGEHKVFVAIYEQLTGYFNNLLPKLASALHATVNLFAVLIMGVYLALQPGLYREWLISLFPPVHRDLVRHVLGDLGMTLRRWIVAQLLAMLLLGALTAVGLYVLRVPYALVFGVFTGAAAIVPFFGALISTVLPAFFVLGGDGGFLHALAVIVLGIVVHVFEANIVAPKIMHRYLHLPPVMTIMSVLVMGKLLGPVGLLVAVPTVAVLDVIMRRILINRIYEGQGFRRTTRDRALHIRVPAPEGGVIVSPAPLDILSIAEAKGRRQVA